MGKKKTEQPDCCTELQEKVRNLQAQIDIERSKDLSKIGPGSTVHGTWIFRVVVEEIDWFFFSTRRYHLVRWNSDSAHQFRSLKALRRFLVKHDYRKVVSS